MKPVALIIEGGMESNVKDLLILMAAVMAVLVLYMLRRKKPNAASLKLKGTSSSSDLTVERGVYPSTGRAGLAKELNVIFNYNGHDWDAYEVLGVPAGCSLTEVELAFHEAVGKVDRNSRSFLEAAYKAIRARRPDG